MEKILLDCENCEAPLAKIENGVGECEYCTHKTLILGLYDENDASLHNGVTHIVPPSIAVAEALRNKGYSAGNCSFHPRDDGSAFNSRTLYDKDWISVMVGSVPKKDFVLSRSGIWPFVNEVVDQVIDRDYLEESGLVHTLYFDGKCVLIKYRFKKNRKDVVELAEWLHKELGYKVTTKLVETE